MFTNAILKLTTNSGWRAVAALPPNCQQVRFAKRTILLKSRYGLEPLYTDDKYEEVVESNQLADLAFKEIRFPRLWETNSPFFDSTKDRFLRYMMVNGRRGLMEEMLHKTFYEIKIIQLRRLRKRMQKQEEEQQQTTKKANSQATGQLGDGEDEEEIITDPLVLFKMAVENCKPRLITRKIRRGGATYQVPYPLSAADSEWFGMKWLHVAVKERPKPREKHYHEIMAQEIIDAAAGRGKVVKRRDDIHKLAQSNKAYAHYRWG